MSSYDNQDKELRDPNTKAAPEVRIVGTIFLACLGAVFIALTYKLVRWIVGF